MPNKPLITGAATPGYNTVLNYPAEIVPLDNPYATKVGGVVRDLARQTAGIEVHDQGQGPGFASNASVRAFSSDHSTDVALWIDGVPVNEPVNGHPRDTMTGA